MSSMPVRIERSSASTPSTPLRSTCSSPSTSAAESSTGRRLGPQPRPATRPLASSQRLDSALGASARRSPRVQLGGADGELRRRPSAALRATRRRESGRPSSPSPVSAAMPIDRGRPGRLRSSSTVPARASDGSTTRPSRARRAGRRRRRPVAARYRRRLPAHRRLVDDLGLLEQVADRGGERRDVGPERELVRRPVGRAALGPTSTVDASASTRWRASRNSSHSAPTTSPEATSSRASLDLVEQCRRPHRSRWPTSRGWRRPWPAGRRARPRTRPRPARCCRARARCGSSWSAMRLAVDRADRLGDAGADSADSSLDLFGRGQQLDRGVRRCRSDRPARRDGVDLCDARRGGRRGRRAGRVDAVVARQVSASWASTRSTPSRSGAERRRARASSAPAPRSRARPARPRAGRGSRTARR